MTDEQGAKHIFRSGVLVTGASGFVGGALCRHLIRDPCRKVTEVSRGGCLYSAARYHPITRLDELTNWRGAFEAVDVVIHCAARAHVMKDNPARALSEFRRVNVAGTETLVRAAAQAGVKRLIFLSSAKVLGEFSMPGRPFRETDSPTPADPYGLSKLEAETAVKTVASAHGMEYVIIRPPLVYGPGVKANFRSMMNWLLKGVPLPLGLVPNKRSLVALDNLVDLIVTCIDHPAAANQIFLVGDGEDLSTTELLRLLGQALGKPARLLPVPVWLLQGFAELLGKREMAQRLCGSLQVDSSKARNLLGWVPSINVDEAMRRTAEGFLAEIRDAQLR